MKSTTTDLYSKYKDYIEDYYNAEEGTRRGDWVFSIIEKYPIQFYEIVEILKQIYEVASFLSFFINLFHLLILTRKSLRNHLVYLVMIGVCICDILQSLGNMTKILMTWMYQFEICFTGEYYKYSHMIVILLTKTAQIMSRRCSSFLALYIAGVRALSVIFPMSNIVTRWTTPKSGFFAMILVGIICTAWSFIFFKNTKLEKVLYCGIGQPKPSYVPYKFKENSKWEFTYFLIDGYMAMFVSISYAIVAFALVIALAVAKRRRLQALEHYNSEFDEYHLAAVFLAPGTKLMKNFDFGETETARDLVTKLMPSAIPSTTQPTSSQKSNLIAKLYHAVSDQANSTSTSSEISRYVSEYYDPSTNESVEESNTSGMIILMTVTVLISEISYAVLYLLNNEVFQDFEDQDIFKQLDSFVLTILILSSTVHCIICFFISSQYRDTVKGLFWEKRQEKDITASVVKSTVPLTEGSSKPSNTSN